MHIYYISVYGNKDADTIRDKVKQTYIYIFIYSIYVYIALYVSE